MDKRGLSEIVSKVLLILIVVAAVAIVWAIISTFLSGGKDNINRAQICVGNLAEVVRCKINETNVSVTAERTAGDEQVLGVQGVRFEVSYADESSKSFYFGNVDFDIGKKITRKLVGEEGKVPEGVKVITMYNLENNNTQGCVSAEKICK